MSVFNDNPGPIVYRKTEHADFLKQLMRPEPGQTQLIITYGGPFDCASVPDIIGVFAQGPSLRLMVDEPELLDEFIARISAGEQAELVVQNAQTRRKRVRKGVYDDVPYLEAYGWSFDGPIARSMTPDFLRTGYPWDYSRTSIHFLELAETPAETWSRLAN